jgi:hypothetical protein
MPSRHEHRTLAMTAIMPCRASSDVTVCFAFAQDPTWHSLCRLVVDPARGERACSLDVRSLPSYFSSFSGSSSESCHSTSGIGVGDRSPFTDFNIRKEIN